MGTAKFMKAFVPNNECHMECSTEKVNTKGNTEKEHISHAQLINRVVCLFRRYGTTNVHQGL